MVASSPESPSTDAYGTPRHGPAAGSEPVAKATSTAYASALEVIASVEPRIAEATRAELADQRASLKLIASENYASPAVLLTMGTWFSDKYAEGTVGHRFYAGCQNVDTVEAIAAEHARSCSARSTPTSSRTPASTPTSSPSGRSWPTGWSRRRWRSTRPRTSTTSPRPTGRRCATSSATSGMLGMTPRRRRPPDPRLPPQHQRQDVPPALLRHRPGDRPARLRPRCAAAAQEFKPLILVAGYSAYPRRVNFAKMREIADEVGATLMVDMAHFAGLVAGKVFTGDEDPVPARPRRHHHHAQVAARPARRHRAGHRGVRPVGRPRLPDGARRPAVARHGRQGRRASPRPSSRASATTPRRSPTTPSRWPRASSRAAPSSSPAAPTTTSCCST